MSAMDKVLVQLRKRFIIIFVSVGGIFLLLAYGTIFAVNLMQTDTMIENRLDDALEKAPFPNADEDAIQSWLARNSCMIILRVEDGSGRGYYTFFNADDVSTEECDAIAEKVFTADDADLSFNLEGKYIRTHKLVAAGGEGETIEVYSVYNWTQDRSDLIESGVTTGIIYLFCLVLLYVFGQLVSRQMIAPVKQSYEQQKQLVADASHELKTPIAIIGANMYLIQSDKTATVEENSHWIDSINAQLARMSALITVMLELYRAVSVSAWIKAIANVSEMLDGILLSFEARCFEKSIELEQDISPGVEIDCYDKQIERQCTILMDNALKYTPEKGRINVSLKADKRNAYLVFTNYGAGIEKEHIEKIFDRFYRVDNARTHNGNSFGLGLSLAKNIVMNHDGEIKCDSDGKTFTKFSVRLPKGTPAAHYRSERKK